MNDLYYIETYMPPPIDKWSALPSFSCMQKGFAMGAWAMLRAHYNHELIHRLRKGDEIIEEVGKQIINSNGDSNYNKIT